MKKKALLAVCSWVATGWLASAAPFSLEFPEGKIVREAELTATAETFTDAARHFSVTRRVVRTDGANYTRTFVTVTNTGSAELPLARVVMFDEAADSLDGGTARVVGEFNGSPVVTELRSQSLSSRQRASRYRKSSMA